MYRARTLFIAGAGASDEVGLPIGSKLLEKIPSFLSVVNSEWGELTGDRTVIDLVHILEEDARYPNIGRKAVIAAIQLISKGVISAPSIDNFLDAHQSDDAVNLLGKFAITQSIIHAEGQSKLRRKTSSANDYEPKNVIGTWYSKFFAQLVEDIPKELVGEIFDNVCVISFNYDRCIEQYLLLALKNYYGISDSVAAEVANKLEIYHPYGKIGKLDWQNGAGKQLKFGGHDRLDCRSVLEISQQIRTFTERSDDDNYISNIRYAVQNAEVIIFLGFAFHERNLQLISPEKPGRAKRVFGTTFGMSPYDASVTGGDIRNWLKRDDRLNIELRDAKCSDLFSEFQRGLTRA